MKICTTALLILMMIFSLVACGQENAGNGEEMPTDTTIEETTESLSEDAASDETDEIEPTEDVAEDVASEPTEETTEDSESESAEELTEDEANEPNEESTEDSASESTGVAEEESANENTSRVDANESGNNEEISGNEAPSGETSSEEASVTTPPVTDSEPVTTPIVVGNDESLSFSGSVTLPSGLTIRTLNEFNSAGMDTSDGNSFMGDIYSDNVAQNYTTMADNFDAFNAMYSGSVINVANGDQIWWRSSMANLGPSIELRRSDDHYKIIISSPILDDATAEALGWMSGREAEAREALTVLLSTISPDCVEVKDAIINCLYIGDSSMTTIPTDFSWARIGQTNIALDEYDFTNGNHIAVFVIRPN